MDCCGAHVCNLFSVLQWAELKRVNFIFYGEGTLYEHGLFDEDYVASGHDF